MLFAINTGYRVLFLLHMVSFLVAFAPAVINPLLANYFAKNGGDPVVRTWSGFTSNYTARISLGAMGGLLLTGIGMVLASEDAWEFSQTWISLAFVLWFAIAGVVSAMILKGERQLAAGDSAGQKLVENGGKVATVLLLVMLYVMIWKPGL